MEKKLAPADSAVKKGAWRIGEIMIQKDWISWTDLKSALNAQCHENRLLGDILVSRGIVTPGQVSRALAYQYGLNFIQFSRIRICPEAVKLIPYRTAVAYQVMPVKQDEDSLTLASSVPLERDVEMELRRITGKYQIHSVLAAPDDLEEVIDFYYSAQAMAA